MREPRAAGPFRHRSSNLEEEGLGGNGGGGGGCHTPVLASVS